MTGAYLKRAFQPPVPPGPAPLGRASVSAEEARNTQTFTMLTRH